MPNGDNLTKTEEAYQTIKEKVLSGEFSAGDRLVERRLMKLLSLSRHPVREALRRLEGEGLVQSPGANRSRRVEYLEDQDPMSVVERYEIRQMLESHAARLAAMNMNAWHVRKLRMLYKQVVELSTSGDREAAHEAAKEFHEYLIGNCGNSLLYRVWHDHHIGPLMSRSAEFDEKLIARQSALAGHRWEAVVDAIEARDADEAARLMYEECQALTVAMRMGLEELGQT